MNEFKLFLLYSLRLMNLGLDFCLDKLGEIKVMKWSLMSSMMDQLIMLVSLQFMRMWSIMDGDEF